MQDDGCGSGSSIRFTLSISSNGDGENTSGERSFGPRW
jgi:hypothetical protein